MDGDSVAPGGRSAPVVMYHSIGEVLPDWQWQALTCPWPLFGRQLQLLHKHGYRAITLDELAERQRDGRSDGERLVGLTFDDGYLDNWVYAYPLMKRYGFRGTIYVNPDFVEDSEELRPSLLDCWEGRCSESDLVGRGFLRWGELRAMLASGIVDVGSHSLTHTWYPVSERIVDFHRPASRHPWPLWNARPDRKPFYLSEDQDRLLPWGTPVPESGRSLGIRRYLPDPAVEEACVRHVATAGGRRYFDREDWRDRLLEVAAGADTGRGRFETPEEQQQRYRREILDSKRLLEERLQFEVRHFCFPGGAYNDLSWRMAEEAGHRTLVVSPRDRKRWLSGDPRLVRRISAHHRVSLAGRSYATSDPAVLLDGCEAWRGRRAHAWRLRARKLGTALARGFRRG